jgi:DnaJ-class molecular chaperone
MLVFNKNTVSERCHLQVNVVPGMRPGTQFVFECEGDDATGCIPGDVCVILKLEPHERFLCAGSDLATDYMVSNAIHDHMRLRDDLRIISLDLSHKKSAHSLFLY